MALLYIDNNYYNTETIKSVTPDTYNMRGELKTYEIKFIDGSSIIVERYKILKWLSMEEI